MLFTMLNNKPCMYPKFLQHNLTRKDDTQIRKDTYRCVTSLTSYSKVPLKLDGKHEKGAKKIKEGVY